MKKLLILLFALSLLGCGADGEPVTPTRDATITLSNAGIAANAGVGLARGPFSVRFGLGL